jgi:hypothetical protein
LTQQTPTASTRRGKYVEFQELDGSPYSAHTCGGILEQMRKREKMKLSKGGAACTF